jgi:hypothetical protein
MSRKDDRYGINMRRWCAEHERQVEEALSQGRVSPALLSRHREKLSWLQHERLIHLIVLMMVVFVELFTVDLVVLHPETNPLAAVMMLALAILLLFYFYHYFFLENTVQRWYKIADDMQQRIKL